MRLKDWICLEIMDCGPAMVIGQIPREFGRLNASLGVKRLDQESARNGEAAKEKVEAAEEEMAQLTAKVEKEAATESGAATEAVEAAEAVEEIETVIESTAEPKVEKEDEAAGLKADVKSEKDAEEDGVDVEEGEREEETNVELEGKKKDAEEDYEDEVKNEEAKTSLEAVVEEVLPSAAEVAGKPVVKEQSDKMGKMSSFYQTFRPKVAVLILIGLLFFFVHPKSSNH